MGKIYINDIGTKFIISTGIDLTGVIGREILIKKPDATETEWAATVEGASILGELSYVAQTGDLNQSGVYYGAAGISFSDSKFTGEGFSFAVWKPFE